MNHAAKGLPGLIRSEDRLQRQYRASIASSIVPLTMINAIGILFVTRLAVLEVLPLIPGRRAGVALHLCRSDLCQLTLAYTRHIVHFWP